MPTIKPAVKPTVINKFRNRDIFLSAVAVALTHEAPSVERERDMIIFVHDATTAFNAAVGTYLSNGAVPAQDFVAAYKSLRAKMYAEKG